MSEMIDVIKTITRLVGSTILLFGIYIMLHGHVYCGGGAAGGVIIGSSLILIVIAHGKQGAFKIFNQAQATVLISVGILAFLFLALSGFYGGRFFTNFLPKGTAFEIFSGGLIPFYDIAIGIFISAAIFVAFVVLSSYRINNNRGEQ